MLVQAIIFMGLALAFYTRAVFSARLQGLQRKHLLFTARDLGICFGD